MVKYGNKCEYTGCGNWSQLDKHLSFFRFPASNRARCVLWALNSGREDLLEMPHHKLHTRYICARHFPDSAFMNELRNRKTHDATPVPYDQAETNLPLLPQVGLLGDIDKSIPRHMKPAD